MRPQQIRSLPPRHNTQTSHSTGRVGDFLAIPMTLAVAPTVGFLVGWFLDRNLQTFPWLTITLLVLGFIAGVREVWQTVKRLQANQKHS